MGNKSGSLRNKLIKARDEDEIEEVNVKHSNKKGIVQIQPYNQDAVDTGFVSPIQMHLPQQQENINYGKRPRSLSGKGIVDFVSEMERQLDSRFRGASLSESLREEFIESSKENKIGKKQFLKLVGFEGKLAETEADQIQYHSCQFLTFFFKACMHVLDPTETGEFMDYSKLLKFTQIMAMSDEEEKLEFFFGLFDTNGDAKIEKDELKDFLAIFFDFLVQTPFGESQQEMTDLKAEILKNKEKDIAIAIKDIAYSFNQDHCNREGYLEYEQWKHWINKEYQFQQIHEASKQLRK